MKNLKNVITVLMIALFSVTNYAQSKTDLVGEWVVGKQNTVVKIELQDDAYCGAIMSSDNPKVEIGKLMVKDLKEKKGKWKGKVYAPQRNEWYDAEFIPKENTLDVKIKVGFMSRTMEWIRK